VLTALASSPQSRALHRGRQGHQLEAPESATNAPPADISFAPPAAGNQYDRFNDIHTHVSLATYLHQREGLQTVLPVVAAVEAIRNDLHALQTLSATDRSRIQEIAPTARKRKRARGQVVLVDRGKGLAISPDGRCFACTSDKYVSVWDAATGNIAQTLQGHNKVVGFVAWSPCSKLLASCSHDKTVRVWEAPTGTSLYCLQGYSCEVLDLPWPLSVSFSS
jgi:hypothetical protein